MTLGQDTAVASPKPNATVAPGSPRAGSRHLRPGSLVQVRSEAEILSTLDPEGRLGGLPFMPEMLPYCGRRFRVSRRIEKLCFEAPAMEMRAFPANDVVVLEGLRCSGTAHGGCQNACMLLWRTAWLRDLPDDPADQGSVEHGRRDLGLAMRLHQTTQAAGRFVCQATSLRQATVPLSRTGRLWKCVRDVAAGTRTAASMLGWIVSPLGRKLRRRVRGEWPRGRLSRTPTEALHLQPGEWVEVKSLAEIVATLDGQGRNRGLHFSEDMAPFCGLRFRVRNRLDRMIIEASGEMREVRNTVVLEGVQCGCVFAVGGCPRGLLQYWREIWLRRVPAPASAVSRPSESSPR